MARMSVDDMVSRDPRITILSKLMGWSRREALGCLVGEVWPICYDRELAVLPEMLVETIAEGLGSALVKAELATVVRDGVRIAGAAERIEYLKRQRENGKKAGKASGKSRASNKASTALQQSLNGLGTEPQPFSNPPDPVPSIVPVPDQDLSVPGETRDEERPHRDQPERALKAADKLRELVLAEYPTSAPSRLKWGPDASARAKWANTLRLLVERDGHSYEELWEVMKWLARQSPTDPYRFVVQSPDSLREKWDRIQAVRQRSSVPQARGSQPSVFAVVDDFVDRVEAAQAQQQAAVDIQAVEVPHDAA